MKIMQEHMYHGAALNQIADHPEFTSINAFKYKGKFSRAAFRVNDDIGVYLKYCSQPNESFAEYLFTFTKEHLEGLKQLRRRCERVFLGLVCVQDREICCLRYGELTNMIRLRKQNVGRDEDQYQVLVTVPEGKKFRVYVNRFGARGNTLGQILIARNAFPRQLFAQE